MFRGIKTPGSSASSTLLRCSWQSTGPESYPAEVEWKLSMAPVNHFASLSAKLGDI